jgi:hypothetical protein
VDIAGRFIGKQPVHLPWQRLDEKKLSVNFNPDSINAALGLIKGLLFYDFCVVLILAATYFGNGVFGIAPWPAVALHSGLAV